METSDKIKLIYIMGGGRSGSTILSILVGNMPGIFFMGELHKWNLYNGIANNEMQEVRKFWQEVYEEMTTPNKYFKKDYFRYLEYHSSMFFLPWLTKKKLSQEFHKFTSELLHILQRKTGANFLLDSSHYPFRAFWLNKNPELDINVIYLYRDPISVTASFRKKNIEQNYKNPISANLFLTFVSILSEIMYHYFPREKRMKIRYEDLIENTDATVHRLKKFIGIQNFSIDFDHLSTGYVFQSNRIRQNRIISLEKKIHPAELNMFWKLFTYILQFPFMFFINKRNYNSLK